jgi:hypothetical protein
MCAGMVAIRASRNAAASNLSFADHVIVRPCVSASARTGIARLFSAPRDKFLAAHSCYEKRNFRSLPKAGLPKAFPVIARRFEISSLRMSAPRFSMSLASTHRSRTPAMMASCR